MRRRYRQDPKTGKLVEITPQLKGIHNTFQVGDLPDIMKDVERNKRDAAKADKQNRRETLINAVNQHYN